MIFQTFFKRNLPKALLLGVSITMCVYVMTNIAYLAVLSPEEMMNSAAVGVVREICFFFY